MLWERFVAAVADWSSRLGVRLTIGVTASRWASRTPGRPAVTAHATRAELVAGREPWVRHACRCRGR